MNTVVLVPRRPDHGERDALWEFCRPIWEARGWPIHEGHHGPDEGPFNRARAVNRAARAAGAWDVALIIDADIWVPEHRARLAVKRATATGQLSYAHTAWWGTTGVTCADLLAGRLDLDDWDAWPDDAWHVRNPLSNSCCLAVRRDLWDRIGGYDERFQGWGGEDWMFYDAAITLGGAAWRPGPEPVIHLWHPLTDEAQAAHAGQPNVLHDANVALGKRWNAATGNRRRILALIAEAAAAKEQP